MQWGGAPPYCGCGRRRNAPHPSLRAVARRATFPRGGRQAPAGGTGDGLHLIRPGVLASAGPPSPQGEGRMPYITAAEDHTPLIRPRPYGLGHLPHGGGRLVAAARLLRTKRLPLEGKLSSCEAARLMRCSREAALRKQDEGRKSTSSASARWASAPSPQGEGKAPFITAEEAAAPPHLVVADFAESRFRAGAKARALHRSSSPHGNRFAGFPRGPRFSLMTPSPQGEGMRPTYINTC